MTQSQVTNPQAVQTATPQSVVMTENAARHTWQMIAGEGNFDLNLRVYINGGGCSGFQYCFGFDDTVKDNDTLIPTTLKNEDKDEYDDGNGGDTTINLVIDPMSLMYLVGSTVDYEEGIAGGQYVVNNPNAQTTCGCGSSFSI